MKVLIAHDSSASVASLVRNLQTFSWTVDAETKLEMMLFALKTSRYDIVFIECEESAALRIATALHASRIRVPMLVSLGSPLERTPLSALQWCDAIRKPYQLRELIARLLLLAHEFNHAHTVMQCRHIAYDMDTKYVRMQGKPVILAKKELQLLELLLRYKNKVVSRAEIHESMWERDADPMANAIEVHIGRLRRKLSDTAKTLIRTIPGFGYMMSDE